MEMARADFQLAPEEEGAIRELLSQAFGLDQDAAQAMLREARMIAEDSVSMQEFTRAIHEGMDYPEKLRVIEMLWQVALADRSLDKYEDYLIGKLGDLLYISRGRRDSATEQGQRGIGRVTHPLSALAVTTR